MDYFSKYCSSNKTLKIYFIDINNNSSKHKGPIIDSKLNTRMKQFEYDVQMHNVLKLLNICTKESKRRRKNATSISSHSNQQPNKRTTTPSTSLSPSAPSPNSQKPPPSVYKLPPSTPTPVTLLPLLHSPPIKSFLPYPELLRRTQIEDD